MISIIVGIIIVVVGIIPTSNQESNIMEIEDILDNEFIVNEDIESDIDIAAEIQKNMMKLKK